ncbi:MAG: hypothetical protein ACP5MK_01995 [Candidatus Micrarchaeia archaeon]
MEFKVKKDIENKLLDRRELHFVAVYEGKTPSKKEVLTEACKKFGLNPETTVVVKISQLYGSTSSEVLLHSYKDKDAMVQLDRHVIERLNKSAGAGKQQEGGAGEAAGGAGNAGKAPEGQ